MNLDDAYANAVHIPGAADYPPRWDAAAMAYREEIGARAWLGRAYGDSRRQAFDLFFPAGRPAGLVIFVHGGYWMRFDRQTWSHLARGPLEAGWAVAMPGYDLCPDVRISDITGQIAKAVTAIAGEVAGDIVLAGHSAGGHLVARMLAPQILPSDVRVRIRRVIPISPVGDLMPLLQTSMNAILHLDAAEAAAESPVRQSAPEAVDVTVWVGADERPAFLDQARWLAEAWDVRKVIAPARHHFDVIEPLEHGSSDLTGLLVGRT